MQEEYRKFYSPALGFETEMLVFGHAGKPVILFPTSMGRFYQNKDFHLIETVENYVNEGKIKIYCPDSIDEMSWYNNHQPPQIKAQNHMLFDKFIKNELVPMAIKETGNDKIIWAGCSFGAYHAVNFGFRYPALTSDILCMGGAFDVKMHMRGYYDENVFYNNPPDYLPGLEDPAIYELMVYLGIGEHDFCIDHNHKLAEIFQKKGIKHILDIRMGENHDWPVWRSLFPDFIKHIIG